MTNRKFCVVTTFNKKGYKQYGKQMIESFLQNWPQEVPLYTYYEKFKPEIENDRLHYIDLIQENPTLNSFLERWKDDKYKNGYEDRLQRVGFRWNAVRFSFKTFAVIHACRNLTDYDVVIWLDADTFTFDKIPSVDFLESMLPNDPEYYCSYLGRGEKKYPECGFVMYNTRHKENANFIDYWEKLYADDSLFDMAEWHDSFVFDQIRLMMENDNRIKSNNLSPGHKGEGHPFINSVLGRYIDHMKGDIRKEVGSSWGVDIKEYHKGHPYWDKIRQDRARRNKATSKAFLKRIQQEKGN